MKINLLSLLMASSLSHAQLPPPGFVNLDFQKANKLESLLIKNLQQIKFSMEKKDWKACSKISNQILLPAGNLKGWVIWNWLKCAQNYDLSQKNLNELKKPLKAIARDPFLDSSGTMGSDFLSSVQSAMALALELENQKPRSRNWLETLNELSKRFDKLDKDKKSLFLAHLHEESDTQSQFKPSEDTAGSEPINSADLEAFTNFERAAQNQADRVGFLQSGASFLQKYPNSVKARIVSEKIQDFLQKLTSDYDMVEQELRDFDPSRWLEWSRFLFKGAHYEMALRLSRRAALASQNLDGSSRAQALFIQGKSAELLGQSSQAQAAFKSFLQMGSSGEEAQEAQFRLAITEYRQQNFQKCAQDLAGLINNTNSHWELQSRYWSYRALQKLLAANPSLQAQLNLERETLLKKYPWTYYGLRIQLEQNQNHLTTKMWDSNLLTTAKMLRVTPAQKEIWKRVEILAQGDWSFEAQRELTGFIWPQKSEQKFRLAQRLAELKLFLQSSKLVNEIADGHPEILNLQKMAFTFPNPYPLEVADLAKSHFLKPVLINSLIRQESGFSTRALSSASAMGLMQLILPTAQEVASELHLQNVNLPEDLVWPSVNLRMGTHYIRKMIDHFQGCIPCGLAAYNAGPVRMDLFFKARPELQSFLLNPSSDPDQEIWFDELQWNETSYYVKAILRYVLLYRTLEQGDLAVSPVLWSDLSLARE